MIDNGLNNIFFFINIIIQMSEFTPYVYINFLPGFEPLLKSLDKEENE